TMRRTVYAGRRTPRLICLGSSLLVLTVFCFVCQSIGSAQGVANVEDVVQGSTVMALTAVPLIEVPPQDGPLYQIGSRIGVIQPKEMLTVSDTKVVRNAKGFNEKWASVQRAKSTSPTQGWVYVGVLGSKSCCFALMGK